MTRHYAVIFLIMLLGVPQIAKAGSPGDKIEDGHLQERAQKILQSEPGAKEVTVRVEVNPKKIPGTNVVDFDGLDIDGDGILARGEVGERLFHIFDRDGNQVIDNIEMKTPSIIVFPPMEKKTVEIVDYYSDAKPSRKSVTYQEFVQSSGLSRFDQKGDGLSPLDFLGMPFNQVNVKDDAVVDLYEWERAYAKSVRPAHMENYTYNN